MLIRMDTFTKGYIRAMLWSTTDDATGGSSSLAARFTLLDLTRDALARSIADCEAFQAANYTDLQADHNDTETQGTDFWLTRAGHGAGYWDGDYPIAGDHLTAAVKAGYPNIDPYASRGKVYT